MMVLVAFAVVFLNGSFLLKHLWPASGPRCVSAGILRGILAVGLGIGIQSVLSYVSLHVFDSLAAGVGIEIVLGLLALGDLLWNWRKNERRQADSTDDREGRSPRAFFCFWVACCIYTFINFVRNYLPVPLGSWDAWTIWNVRASFLAEGGSIWREAFGPYQSHADYPLLLPLAVARSWTWMGSKGQAAPLLLAIFFTFGSLGLTTAALTQFRDRTTATIAGFMFLGMPLIFSTGICLYADIPLAFYFLASGVCLYRAFLEPAPARCFVLAGFFLGCAAWTKNEGIQFAALGFMVSALFLLVSKGLQGTRNIGWMLAGFAPFGLLLIHQKIAHACPNDLIDAMTFSRIIDQVSSLERWQMIAEYFWSILPVIVTLPILCFIPAGILLKGGWRPGIPEALLMVLLGLQTLGYLFFYLTTPHDLSWHLSTSLDRIVAQIMPLGVFAAFMLIGSPSRPNGAAPGWSIRSPLEKTRIALGIACLVFALWGVYRLAGKYRFVAHNLADTYEQLRRSKIMELMPLIPEDARVGFLLEGRIHDYVPYAASRYLFIPRIVEPNVEHPWIIAVHPTRKDAEAFANVRGMDIAHELEHGIRLFRKRL